MSILPLLLELTENRPFEDAFGYVVFPEQMQHPRLRRHQSVNTCSRPICKRQCALKPHHMLNKYQNTTDLTKHFEKDGFQVSLDVKDFAPNEISVKTIDQTIIVEGNHAEKEDEHGHISRHFIRKYTLPKEVDVNDVISTLSTDGQLTIKAPPKQKAVDSAERIIQIQHTGEVHQSLKTKSTENVTTSVKKTAE